MLEESPIDLPIDPHFAAQLERLRQFTVLGRWAVVVGLWLTIGIFSLWALRYHIGLIHNYFTWSAVRYAFRSNWWSAVGLILCISMTVSVLTWQSRHVLFGLAPEEQQRLKTQLLKIQQQGASHPLWTWINRN
jgi:hypothetical protein